MAFAIEARTPFLDYRLVERALALPAEALIRDGWTKAILREAMRGDPAGDGAPAPRQARLRDARRRAGCASSRRRSASGSGRGPRARVAAPAALDGWLAGDDASLARRPGLWRLVSVELWRRQAEDLARAA